MFGKKPDLKKELNDLFVKNYSKMEDAILKPLQQKAYERLADNPNDIYLGKFNLVTFRPENVSYRSDMAVFNKKVPVIKLYINDKFERKLFEFDYILGYIEPVTSGDFKGTIH